MKRIACLALAVLILFSFTACDSIEKTIGTLTFLSMRMLFDDSATKEEIVEFVSLNQNKLEECAEKEDFSEFEGVGIVKSVYESEGYTDFYCGGKGLAAGPSYYCGFYYSPLNSADAMWKDKTLVPWGDGFVYEEDNGNNRFYSEKIIDCFWFYEEYW